MSYTKFLTASNEWNTYWDPSRDSSKEKQTLFIEGYGSYTYRQLTEESENVMKELGADDDLRCHINAFIDDVNIKFQAPIVIVENNSTGGIMGLIRALFLHGNQLRKQLVAARAARRAEIRKYVWWSRLLVLFRARRIAMLRLQAEVMKLDNK